MTEDQSRRPWETGYVVRGEVVGEGEEQNEQAAPVTYFHKVASPAHRDEPDTLAPTALGTFLNAQFNSLIPTALSNSTSP